MDDDEISGAEDEPWPHVPPSSRIEMAPLLRGLGAESLELRLTRKRLLTETRIEMTSAKLRIQAALADAPFDASLDVMVVCRGLKPLPVEALVAQLQASGCVDVERGRIRRGPTFGD